ncbi:uncharacterized protein ISCGN_032996 [Ixodes scapularis]
MMMRGHVISARAAPSFAVSVSHQASQSRRGLTQRRSSHERAKAASQGSLRGAPLHSLPALQPVLLLSAARNMAAVEASISLAAATSAVGKHVQGHSDTQESESILPDDGPGWGSSSDNSLMRAVTIKTGLDGSGGNTAMTAVTIKKEPPEYVEQDEEPSSHLVSVKSEPECYEEVWKPRNPVPALTNGEPRDYTDVTKVAFHTNPGLDGSGGNTATTAVTIKTGYVPRKAPIRRSSRSVVLSPAAILLVTQRRSWVWETPIPPLVSRQLEDVQGDSDTQESESILPDDGPGWGSSSDNSLTRAVTIKTEPPDPTEVQTEDVSTGTACAAPSFALLPLLHPAVQQSSASQGGQHSAPPHSLPALGPLLPLSASRNMAAPEASISSAPAALAVAKRGRPRQYTADELRERNNAARRAKRLAARAKRQADKLAIVLKSLNARRAKRAAAQRARRQNEAFRKREKEAARESEHLERQEASISSVAATSAVVKPSRPRKYTAEELRERKSALQRARRQAARPPKVVKSPDTRRAERAAAQRARRQKAERLKLQKASMSSVATTSAVAKQPPEYAEQDEEPSSYLVSVKSEPGCYEEVREPNSLVPTFTKDYADVTKVTFHLNAEPQISEETLRQHNMAVAVKIEPPDPPEVHSKAVSMGTARAMMMIRGHLVSVCTVPSLAVPSLPHPAARQSPASQGGPHGVSPHSLPAPRHLLLLSAPRNMATSEASISAVAATSEIVKRGRGRPRQYTADELRERLNAAKRAKRKAAKSTIVGKSPKTRCKSPNTRRAERAAAQRARRQNEAIRKREREMDRKAKRLKRQKASISSVAATSAHVKRWGSSCDSSLTRAVTIKTEPPEYVEQDKEPSSHLVSVKSDYTDMTKVTFLFNAEPQVSEETRRRHNTAVFVGIEAPDLTELHTEAISKGSGLDGSGSNTATTAVTIKTEPEYYKEVWEPGNLVPALTNGEPPDHRDVTKVTFHTNPEPQVSKGAQQRNNAAVAVKTEPQDPTGFDAPAIFLGAGPGAASLQEVGQHQVLVDPTVAEAVGHKTVRASPAVLRAVPWWLRLRYNRLQGDFGRRGEVAECTVMRLCNRLRVVGSVDTTGPTVGHTEVAGFFGPDQFQMALRRSDKEKEGSAHDVQGHSDTEESESILPDDGPEPPEYVEQDEEPSSHLVSVKSEPEFYEDVKEPNSLVPALTKDYTDMTKVTFHFNAEPQVSEETRRWHNTTVAVKIEPPDPTEVHTEAVSTGTGLDGSSGNTVMTAVTIKTEPPEYVEQDEEPSSHLVSVKPDLGAAPLKEFQQAPVPTNSIGSYAVVARPLRWVPTSVRNEVQPQADIVYLRNVERHGIPIQPVVATLAVVAVLPERPDVVPP